MRYPLVLTLFAMMISCGEEATVGDPNSHNSQSLSQQILDCTEMVHKLAPCCGSTQDEIEAGIQKCESHLAFTSEELEIIGCLNSASTCDQIMAGQCGTATCQHLDPELCVSAIDHLSVCCAVTPDEQEEARAQCNEAFFSDEEWSLLECTENYSCGELFAGACGGITCL